MVQAIERHQSAVNEAHGVKFLWLEITSKCNLTCQHCYAESGPQNSLFGVMEKSDWLSMLAQAAEQGCRQVQFIGGEPTLHPDLRDLIDEAVRLGYSFIEVYTNATTLTDDLARFFAARNVHVATSFYSSDRDIHDRITARKGSFELTVSGIQRAVECGIPLRAGFVETEHNSGHFASAKELLNDLGVKSIRADKERGIGRGATELAVDPMSELCGQCWRGKLCITASGDTYPCVFSRFVQLGDVRAKGVKGIVDSAELSAFRTKLQSRPQSSNSYDPASNCDPDCVPNCTPSHSCDPCPPLGCQPPCDPAGPCDPTTCEPASCDPASAGD